MILNRPQQQLLRRLGNPRGKIPRQTILAIRSQILHGDIDGAWRRIETAERRCDDGRKTAAYLAGLDNR